MRANLDVFAIAIFSAAGLLPLGCGGRTTGGSGGGGGATSPFPCSSPQDLVAGESSGFVRCGETNYIHRSARAECPSLLPRPDACTADPAVSGSECTFDLDCAAAPNGRCTQGIDSAACYCNYGCETDDDCTAGRICLCGDAIGQCVEASCTTDADCGPGLLCSSYVASPGCGGTAFACQTQEDTCAADTDCPDGTMCAYENGRHTCVQPGCAIGRPFLVAGHERLAPVTAEPDWSDVDVAIDPSHLDRSTRAALAEQWTDIGRMEHASVAAFGRFALQLLSLGAPPELLSHAQTAMADETRHARLAFSLASTYGGHPVSPGPLPMEGALDELDLEAIVTQTIIEGCIGETVAAVEAAEGALAATDGAIRSLLGRVADDETRHAELAWRFVAWVRSRGRDASRIVDEAFTRALAEARRQSVSGAPADLDAHGILDRSARQAVRERVLEDVVAPCARALCEAAPGVPQPAPRGTSQIMAERSPAG